MIPTCSLTNRSMRAITASVLDHTCTVSLKLNYTNTLGILPKLVSQQLSLRATMVQDRTVSLIFESNKPVFLGWSQCHTYGYPQVVLIEGKTVRAVESLQNITLTIPATKDSSCQSENPTVNICASPITSQEFDTLRKPRRQLFDQTKRAYVEYCQSSPEKLYFRVHRAVVTLPLLA